MNVSSQQLQKCPFDAEHLTSIYSIVHSADEAERRARNVLNDFRKIGITPTLNLLPFYEGRPIPFYTFGQSDFALDNLEKNVADTLKAVGFGLNWGDLYLLSHVCEFGREIWGENWVLKFREKLSNFPDHLAAIEELWWLGLWYSPTEVKDEVHLGNNSNKTVDWRFNSCGQIVNLEVKLRPRDWKRGVDGKLYSMFHKSIFEGIAGKFCTKRSDELNIVGLTVLSPLDRDTAEAAENFLVENDTIDGLIFWSTGMGEQSPVHFHLKPHAQYAKVLFRKPDHDYRFTLILHPWMDSEKRRAKWLGIEEDFSKIDGLRRKVGRILVPCHLH